MKIKSIILPFVLCLVSTVCSAGMRTVNISDYSGDYGGDCTRAVAAIFEEFPQGGVKIVFPKGEYHFYSRYAKGKYHAVTNHDNGYKYFAFPIEGMKNVEIDGQGSDFIFHGVMTPFLVDHSANVVLKDFSIDWEEPFYIQGTVMESDAVSKSMKIKFSDFSEMDMEGNRIVLTNNENTMYFLGETMVFDPKTNAVAYNASDYIFGGPSSRTPVCRKLGDWTYEIKGAFAKRPAPEGLVYVFKGPNASNRLAPAIHVCGSSDFRASSINIYHAGGMGVIAEKSRDIHLDAVNVCLREGSGRMVTTTADATHFCNCAGQLVIENCLFENMLDDASNIHGTYLKVEEVLDGRTVLAKLSHHQQFDYDFAEKGDVIRIVDSNTLLPKKELKITGCRKLNNIYTVVTFSRELEGAVQPGDGLENISWYPDVIFRNNVVRNNRARSILISSGRKVLVEGNSFSSMMASVLFEGDLDHWHESGAVSDVTIRNNVFLDSCYGGRKASLIWINPHLRTVPKGGFYESGIVIENNEFRSFDRSVLNAFSVDGLVFRNNSITPSGTYKPFFPDMPEINIRHCRNVSISGNVHNGDAPAEVVVDKPGDSSVGFDGDNVNIIMK